MNDNQEMINLNENESSNTQEEYVPKKSRTVDFLILLACLIAAFIFWCSAHYIADPIIEKEIDVKFVLVNGAENEYIVQDPIRLVFFGKESVLKKLEVIEMKVERSVFVDYDVDTKVSTPKTNDYHTHTKEVMLQLTQTESND